MVSRVALPDLNTASSLLNVSLPSGVNGWAGRPSARCAASSSIAILPPGNRPPVRVISPALTPPSVEPVLERQPHVAGAAQVVHDVAAVHQRGRRPRAPPPTCRRALSAANAARAAYIPDCIA